MSTAGQDRRADRRARRRERRAARRERRAERGWGEGVKARVEEWRKDGDEAAAAEASGPIATGPFTIPGPGAQGTGWAGTPDAPDIVATTTDETAGGWWMDPKILLLGAAAVFILMRPKK